MLISFPLIWKGDLPRMGQELQAQYVKNKNISLAPTPAIKISHKTFLPELKTYLAGMINVLLYDLSMNSQRRELTCDGTCLVALDKTVVKQNSLVLESSDGFLYVESGENYLTPQQVMITSSLG